MNITPNSFSDGSELASSDKILERIKSFGPVDAIDVGAESTAPMNAPISHQEEWERLKVVLPLLTELETTLSIDTYHPETILEVAKIFKGPLIWNDVSGKFDDAAIRFLMMNNKHQYVFCHNLAPSRDETSAHMKTVSKAKGEDFLHELADYFNPNEHPRVIFDPCLGFSKTEEQNWFILDNFTRLQELVPHRRWMLGFSRKSFLRKKLGVDKVTLENRGILDQFHGTILDKLRYQLHGEVWIRTHRPELVIPNS